MNMSIEELSFLVAEDHDFQRRTLLRILAGLGAKHVAEAADGNAALEIFRGAQRPVDIIISDLEMPGMDGMEFIRHVGASGVPVSVILSSALDPALVSSVERSEEHTSELQSLRHLVCRLLLEKKKKRKVRVRASIRLFS